MKETSWIVLWHHGVLHSSEAMLFSLTSPPVANNGPCFHDEQLADCPDGSTQLCTELFADFALDSVTLQHNGAADSFSNDVPDFC